MLFTSHLLTFRNILVAKSVPHPLANSTPDGLCWTGGHHGVFKRCVIKDSRFHPHHWEIPMIHPCPSWCFQKKNSGNSYGEIWDPARDLWKFGEFSFFGDPRPLEIYSAIQLAELACEWWYVSSARGFTAFHKSHPGFYFIPNWSWSFGEIRKK